MNSSDQIQSQRNEIAFWEKRLRGARLAYDIAVSTKHQPGHIREELEAIRTANEHICDALFKLSWLRWCNESDEERARTETNVHS